VVVQTRGRVDTALNLLLFPGDDHLHVGRSQWAWTSVVRGERGTDTAFMPLLGPVKSALPIGIAFLIVQGISELLKSLHAARKGQWPV
jgi:TRAP-type mannitol/chloroaromatic compound transport system permease small subunit